MLSAVRLLVRQPALQTPARLVLIKATLGLFFPIFGDGTTVAAIVSATVLLWAVHFMVLRGIKEAAAINTIATFAKIVPIAPFHRRRHCRRSSPDVFVFNFWRRRGTTFGNVGKVQDAQFDAGDGLPVSSGSKGASVYSPLPRKRREDVGIATVLGFLGRPLPARP